MTASLYTQPVMRTLSLLAVAMSVSCGGVGLPASANSPVLGKPAPRFKRKAIDGREAGTAAGSPKYCEPCKKTLPAAERLTQEHPSVAFVGVAEDEYQADVEETVQRYRLSFPVIHDRAQVLSGRFRVNELPFTFVIDKTGTVRWIGGPKQTESDLEAAVEWVSR